MSREIKSKVIGQLRQDETFSDWWTSQEIEIPFFDKEKFAITFMDFEPEKDKTFMEEADRALANFLGLGAQDRLAISELVFKNCEECMEALDDEDVNEDLRQIKDAKEIWNFVYPSEIYVARRERRDKKIYIQIACDCDWEEEHGLQLVFRQGKKITRVSDQDGHLTEADAYDKPDSEDELLSYGSIH